MKNQFFYNRTVEVPSETINDLSSVAPPPKYVTVRDSFNLNKIIMTIGMSDVECIVVLDDFHEETKEIPVAVKNGKTLKTRKEKGLFQTNITLRGEDYERFIKLTNIED